MIITEFELRYNGYGYKIEVEQNLIFASATRNSGLQIPITINKKKKALRYPISSKIITSDIDRGCWCAIDGCLTNIR